MVVATIATYLDYFANNNAYCFKSDTKLALYIDTKKYFYNI